jgi:ketosteroid isomerase-like protein
MAGSIITREKIILRIVSGLGVLSMLIGAMAVLWQLTLKEEELAQVKTVVVQEQAKLKSIEAESKKEKQPALDRKPIEDMIARFVTAQNGRDLDGYAALFADKAERYYLMEHVDKKEIRKLISYHWKRYPVGAVSYDLANLSLSKEGDFVKVLVKGTVVAKERSKSEAKSTDIVTEFRVNAQGLIFYVRDYYARGS